MNAKSSFRKLQTRQVAAAVGLAAGLLVGLFAGSAMASPVIFSGSGVVSEGATVSARVEFDVVEHDFNGTKSNALQVTVLNTSALTTRPEASLTGLYFANTGGAFAAVDRSSKGFDGLATLVRQANGNGNSPEKVFNDVDLGPAKNGTSTDGTYLAGETSKAQDGQHSYVITTVETGQDGYSTKDLNYEDYGIVAAGSPLRKTELRNTAWVDGSAVFWIRMNDLSNPDLLFLDNVSFSFSDDAKVRIKASRDSQMNAMVTDPTIPLAVPEPSQMLLLGAGLATIAVRLRRARAKA